MRSNFKLLILILSLFISFTGKSQNVGSTFDSAPSAAGLTSYNLNPISYSTGIPNIDIPFFSLPTHGNHIVVSPNISYHPNNAFLGSKASEVGRGWSLNGAGCSISREMNPNNGFPDYNYTFNLFGSTGRFYFIEESDGTLTINKLTNNKFDIIATKISTDNYFFTIRDTNGYTYYFDIKDISCYPDVSNPVLDIFTKTYYLSKITNTSGVIILNCQYVEDNHNAMLFFTNHLLDTKAVKSLKISKITSIDFGSVQFNYLLDQTLIQEGENDQFGLTDIELQNNAGIRIQKYSFSTGFALIDYRESYDPAYVDPCRILTQFKRTLTKLQKYDANNNVETTNFDYLDAFTDTIWPPAIDPRRPQIGCYDDQIKNPFNFGISLLRSITYPTGTKVVYEFEPNQYFVDKNTSDYLWSGAPPYQMTDKEAQYYEDVALIRFDTVDPNSQYSFILPTNPDNAEGSSYLKYWIHVDEYYTGPFQGPDGQQFMNFEFTSGTTDSYTNQIKQLSGRNFAEINGTGGRGTVTIRRLRYKSVPLPNYTTGRGVRIKKIEYYDNNNLVDSETQNFEYQKFDDNNMPSGYYNGQNEKAQIVYKNVKERIGNSKGYTKYYFKTVEDGPYIGGIGNVLDNGLLFKKEAYSSNSNLIAKDSTNFIFGGGYIKQSITTSTMYHTSGNLTQNSEVNINGKDYNITNSKDIISDGTVLEKFYTYPWLQLPPNQRLWDAGMKNVQLVVETKRNGITTSKTENKFEDLSNLYPSSQISYLPLDLTQSVKNISYDSYDDKGNLVQFTTFPDQLSGKPTTVIWGYNKTVPIAKIEGAKLSDIPVSLITSIVNASNDDANATLVNGGTTELALKNALNALRTDNALKNFMVTCFTYDPLIGVTSVTPPSGLTEVYKYDASNRLQSVLDINGNILKEYQYNYKP